MKPEERKLTEKLTDLGFGKAAESLAFFLRHKVIVNTSEVRLVDFDDIQLSDLPSDEQDMCVLSTEIIGEMKGISYLVFKQSEVDKIVDISFPESIKSDPEKLKEMTKAILLEMDNIIVASVVTQFANVLEYKIYGDVPHIHYKSSNELFEILKDGRNYTDKVMFKNVVFKTEGVDISPSFIWVLDSNYSLGIERVIKEQRKGLEILGD